MAHDVMKLIFLFYMCDSVMGLTRCYKMGVFTFMFTFSTKWLRQK